MKKIKVLTVLAIAFCFLLGTTAVYAADSGYSLIVSGGNGTLDGSSNPVVGTNTVEVVSGTSDKISVDGGEAITVKPPESKYFVRGLKLAGHDNDEIYTSIATNHAGTPQDTSVVVAYGLKSNMVKYTVSYIDENGAELVGSDTHYGVIGDRPIVTFKQINGYLPASATELTLSPDASTNTITLTYTPAQAGEGDTIINNNAVAGGNAAAGANAAAGNAAGNAAAAPGTATIGDNQTPQAINDQDTPLAANPDEEEGGLGAFPFIIGGVIAAGIIAAIAAVLARRRGEEDAE